MSLTTEEIIGGMYRAHRAGQPFAALVANPQFANLPMEQKQQVLSGLRQRMGGESTSAVNALTSIVKSTAGGALAGVPLGVAVPLALEMSDSGATKKSVLAALRMAAENKNVKLLVGTGATLGALGGLFNAAMRLRQDKLNREQIQTDLAEAAEGGEALAAASFGAIGNANPARQVNLEPVIKTFRDISVPHVMASARFGHAGQMVDDAKNYGGLTAKTHERLLRGVPLNPQRLQELAAEARQYNGHANALHSLVVNSPVELNIDPSTLGEAKANFQRMSEDSEITANNLSALEQYVRQVRDAKRGVQ